MRLRHAICLSWSLGWLLLTGCSQDPYLRSVSPAYNQQGELVPESYMIPKPYLKHLLADLKACYKDAER
jgi:hypothetical protein